ncbi:MAG TPA: hypothetical protein VHX63_06425 [Acidobacteriaceae bacterium]|jgi:hypothetical protein|nr:hypothetical protein [Acidobacteriaceae bacterium]
MTYTTIMIGFFFGFFLGVGCALAVMYSIYAGGYRKAIADSLLVPHPAEYTRLLLKAQAQKQA